MLNTDSRKRLLAACLALAMTAGLMGPAIAQACAVACETATPEPVKAEVAHCAMQDAKAACCPDSEAPTPAKKNTVPPLHEMAACECTLTAPAAIPLARAAESRILSQPISSSLILSDTSVAHVASPFMNASGSPAREGTAPAYLYFCVVLR